MYKILFLRNQAFLPEIDAYIKYFNKSDEFKAYDSLKLAKDYKISDFDIVWEVKGFGGTKVGKHILVHDYASLSTGSFPRVKDYLKVKLNPKPDLRNFLNEKVRQGFNFKDDIDFSYRDMGIDEKFIKKSDNNKKEYDFVYMGAIVKGRGMDKFLKEFIRTSPGKLCLVGNVDDDIYEDYKNNENLLFTGKVPYSEVPEIASKAVYGINYIPDEHPFNIQTSTKLLEYLALDLKVITTDYEWLRKFEQKNNSSYYKLDYDNLVFDYEKIKKHKYINNFKAEDYLWDKVIEQSEIKEKLLKLLE